MEFTAKVIRVGNSAAVRIPRANGWIGDEVTVVITHPESQHKEKVSEAKSILEEAESKAFSEKEEETVEEENTFGVSGGGITYQEEPSDDEPSVI